MRARSAVRQILRMLGVEISRYRGDGLALTSLKRLSCPAATIIDVGAAFGTQTFYDAFPDSYRVLIEPLTEYEPQLKKLTEFGRGEYHLVALGEQPGQAKFKVQPDQLTKSSFHVRTDRTSLPRESYERTILVETLDRLYAANQWADPIVLKIDTEGAEDAVLRGAQEVLRVTECVIIEVSVARRFQSSYRFAELIRLLDENEFDLVDVLTIPRLRSGELAFMDCAFKRRTEPDANP